MKSKTKISLLIIIGIVFILTNSCKKDTNVSNPVSVNGIYFNTNLTYGTLKDIDSNVYRTIKIGTQTWMSENLKVTKYCNGDTIPNVTGDSVWRNLTTGACCSYNNDNSNVATYGKLYNYYTVVDPRNLCPVGWHVPRHSEWDTLITYLGSYAGGKLKEAGNTHWNNLYSVVGSNESGFTALPGGDREDMGTFELKTYFGAWMSYETEYREMSYMNNGVGTSFGSFTENSGYSVRCVKD